MFQMKMTSNGIQPQQIKVEYLSNHWSVHNQILILSLDGPIKSFPMLQMKISQTEDDLKILKVEYLKFQRKTIYNKR